MHYKIFVAISYFLVMCNCYGESICSKTEYFLHGWSNQLEKVCLTEIDKENAEAVALYGLHLVDSDQVESGLGLLELAVQKDNNFALYWAGMTYIRKLPSKENILKAESYLRRVSHDLEPSALINIAELYAEGNYIERDMAEAERLVVRSASILMDEKQIAKINSDIWLKYQWHHASNEFGSFMKKYKISSETLSTLDDL